MENYENNKEDHEFSDKWKSPYPTMSSEKIDESWERFLLNVPHQRKNSYRRDFIKLGSVAAVLLVLFLTYFYLEMYNATITVTNFSDVDKRVELPDGSLVFLKEGATIEFTEEFRNSREVLLIGNAFFDVVKDSLREFSVTSGVTKTRVLGTTFSVKTTEGTKDVEVSLYTGRVLVSVQDEAESWAIIPGERFVLQEGKASIRNFNPDLSFERGNEFIDINNFELEELYEFLDKRFGYEFEKDSVTENKLVTLRINKSDSLNRILEVLSIINNIDYVINENTKQVQIYSK